MTARWPRFMTRKAACEYVMLSEAAFEREVAAGTLPAPVALGGKDHWCRSQLDSFLDRLAGGQGGSWRDSLPIYQEQASGAHR